MHLLEKNVVGPSCMGKGRNTGNAVVTVYMCLSGIGSSNQMLSSSGAVGKSSSSAVASWKESSVFGVDV